MIDWDRVLELRNDVGEDDFAEIVELFLAEVQEVVDRLRQSPPPHQLEKDLHFIKGSAYNLGFDALGGMCTAGERLIAGGQPEAVELDAILSCYEASRGAFLSGLDDLHRG